VVCVAPIASAAVRPESVASGRRTISWGFNVNHSPTVGLFSGTNELPTSPPLTTPTPLPPAAFLLLRQQPSCRQVSATQPRRTRMARLPSAENSGVTCIHPFSGTPMLDFGLGPTNLHHINTAIVERSCVMSSALSDHMIAQPTCKPRALGRR
jgi:hypothetical protein